MEELFIIVGLGNPGKKYEKTWHNAGFNVVDYFSNKHNIQINKIKFKGIIGEGNISGKKVILLKPQTYMNLSGESVKEIVEWYKIPIKNLLVIYDDIDVELGKIKVKHKGSSGSHNGMKSIIYHMISDEFPRLRVGIGKPPLHYSLVDFVLSSIREEHSEKVFESYKKACDAIETFLSGGIDATMNKFNGK